MCVTSQIASGPSVRPIINQSPKYLPEMEKGLLDLHLKDLTASDLTDSFFSKDDLELCDLDPFSQSSSRRLSLKYTCRRRLNALVALPKRLLRAGSTILPSYIRHWSSR